MREKIFYIVNLDKKRISILSLFLLGLLFSFFFLGVSVGKGNAMAKSQEIEQVPGDKEAKPEAAQNQVESSQNEETIQLANIAPADKESGTDTNPTSQPEPKESEVINLTTPEENIKRQEEIFSQKKAPPMLKKHTPKKVSNSDTTSSKLGIYTVQLVAFTSKTDADFYVKKILKENPNLKNKPFITHRGRFFLVRIGSSSQKAELRSLLSKLNIDEKIRSQALIVKNS
jgi:cell division septation protein DedD